MAFYYFKLKRKKVRAVFSATKHPYGQSTSRTQDDVSRIDNFLKSRIIPDNNFIQEKKLQSDRPPINRVKSAVSNKSHKKDVSFSLENKYTKIK